MQEPEPIDWEYYRKGIGSRLVDMYKEAYDSMFSDLLCAVHMYNTSMNLSCISSSSVAHVYWSLPVLKVFISYYAIGYCFELKT